VVAFSAGGDGTLARPRVGPCHPLHSLHLVELFFENKSLLIFDNKIWSLQLRCTRCTWEMVGIFSPPKY